MSGLLGAVSLLTRVPIGGRGDPSRAAGWMPLVGTAIGLAVGGVYAALIVVVPPLVAAGVAVGAGMLLTGALHEDGLADSADAFGVHVDRDETLRILRDPRLGTFGVAALVVSVVVRTASVAALGAVAGVLALAMAHTAGRASAALVMARNRPAEAGLGSAHAGSGGGLGLVWAAAVASAAGVFATLVVVVAATVALGAGRFARRRIGGYTGDVLGATEQVTEIAVLVVAVAAAGHPAAGLLSLHA